MIRYPPNFNTGESNMWTAFWLGVCAIFLGFFSLFFSRLNDKLGSVIRWFLFLGGVTLWIYTAILHDEKSANARADWKNRTHSVTKVVIEVDRTHTKDYDRGECVLKFKLESVPHTLEVRCYMSVELFLSPPRVGDVMYVEFVAPKVIDGKPDGKPEVLEVYNLTQEMEQVLGAPLCKTENPPHILETPSVLPETSTRWPWETKPLPDVY
jgi:LPXTG-motif cell wall-anchored protein